ncbi:hypothetical protein EIP91_001496 [Steccherinum ochraceum]|uniref:HIG1 domain-containing protein n=1 Tax=Steccherinum ochraceum TaxID=92696 RepID=A0A4R0RSG9_9APHY|nr:hypothetical protein EIP91_001496 [Steccherinum ochraceum]
MKFATEEELAGHHAATVRGAIEGVAAGFALSLPASYYFQRNSTYYRSLPPHLKVLGVILVVAPLYAVQAERRGVEYDQSTWTGAGQRELMREELEEEKRWKALSMPQRAKEWATKNQYKVILGTWAVGMAAAGSIIWRNRHQSTAQKVVQARMWAQGLTIGVMVAAGILTHQQRQEAAEHRGNDDHSWSARGITYCLHVSTTLPTHEFTDSFMIDSPDDSEDQSRPVTTTPAQTMYTPTSSSLQGQTSLQLNSDSRYSFTKKKRPLEQEPSTPGSPAMAVETLEVHASIQRICADPALLYNVFIRDIQQQEGKELSTIQQEFHRTDSYFCMFAETSNWLTLSTVMESLALVLRVPEDRGQCSQHALAYVPGPTESRAATATVYLCSSRTNVQTSALDDDCAFLRGIWQNMTILSGSNARAQAGTTADAKAAREGLTGAVVERAVKNMPMTLDLHKELWRKHDELCKAVTEQAQSIAATSGPEPNFVNAVLKPFQSISARFAEMRSELGKPTPSTARIGAQITHLVEFKAPQYLVTWFRDLVHLPIALGKYHSHLFVLDFHSFRWLSRALTDFNLDLDALRRCYFDTFLLPTTCLQYLLAAPLADTKSNGKVFSTHTEFRRVDALRAEAFAESALNTDAAWAEKLFALEALSDRVLHELYEDYFSDEDDIEDDDEDEEEDTEDAGDGDIGRPGESLEEHRSASVEEAQEETNTLDDDDPLLLIRRYLDQRTVGLSQRYADQLQLQTISAQDPHVHCACALPLSLTRTSTGKPCTIFTSSPPCPGCFVFLEAYRLKFMRAKANADSWSRAGSRRSTFRFLYGPERVTGILPLWAPPADNVNTDWQAIKVVMTMMFVAEITDFLCREALGYPHPFFGGDAADWDSDGTM